MAHTIALNTPSRGDWLTQLVDVMTDPDELLFLLSTYANEKLLAGHNVKKLLVLCMPRSLIDRMEKGNPNDPLLRQVLISRDELIVVPGFSTSPLEGQHSVMSGLLHKYHNQVFLLVKGGYAVNCRYCFHHHFPYAENQDDKRSRQTTLECVAARPELDEMIFSSGDSLMVKDHELGWLPTQPEAIPHIERLRIHNRLPIAISARVTDVLVRRFSHPMLQILLANHINHASEADETFRQAMTKLRRVGATLLNQSVLLRGTNDNTRAPTNLSNASFDAGVIPYYLYVPDEVQGMAYFMVSDDEVQQTMRELLTLVSGYLVPKLAREIGGEPSKTLLDSQPRQQ